MSFPNPSTLDSSCDMVFMGPLGLSDVPQPFGSFQAYQAASGFINLDHLLLLELFMGALAIVADLMLLLVEISLN